MNQEFRRPAGYIERAPGARIIVCAGIGQHYFYQYLSTLQHCDLYEPETWQLFQTEYPDGCPDQSTRQYAFKCFMIDRVINAGFHTVLWLDAAFQPIAPLTPLWKIIEEHGWYIPKQGDAVLGNWCSDQALGILGARRDEAMTVPLVYTGIVGLHLRSYSGARIWQLWKQSYESGAWDGPHKNQPKTERWGHKFAGPCSSDPRCQGHRHDEAAMSWILHQLQMQPRAPDVIDGMCYASNRVCIGHHVPHFDVARFAKAFGSYQLIK